MERIIIYGIGSDFHTYFDEVSLYRSLTEEMEVAVVALCDGNEKRLGANGRPGICHTECMRYFGRFL